jgi:hypothetical protein
MAERDIQEELEEQYRLSHNLKPFDGLYVAVIGDQVVESAKNWTDLFEKVAGREDVTCLYVSSLPHLYAVAA